MRYLKLFMLLIPLTAFGQQEYEQALIESETGGYMIFTNDSNSLVFHLDTAKIELIETENSFFTLVDNTWTLQLFTLGYQNPNTKDISDLEVQKSFLLQYMNYELDYFKSELKMNIENSKASWGSIGNKHFLLWHFETPDLPTVQKQIYLSTICFDKFLNINIPLETDQNFADGYDFLDRVAKSLELHEHPTDIEEFYKRVNGL